MEAAADRDVRNVVAGRGSLSSGNSRLLMLFVGMVAVAMIVQAIAVFVIARSARQRRANGAGDCGRAADEDGADPRHDAWCAS